METRTALRMTYGVTSFLAGSIAVFLVGLASPVRDATKPLAGFGLPLACFLAGLGVEMLGTPSARPAYFVAWAFAALGMLIGALLAGASLNLLPFTCAWFAICALLYVLAIWIAQKAGGANADRTG